MPSTTQKDWYEFRFVSDNTLTESPLLIMPSLMLNRNEKSAKKLRMSGEIILYRGACTSCLASSWWSATSTSSDRPEGTDVGASAVA